MPEIPNSMNMIQDEREVDRSSEHDPILEKFWEIDKQAQQAKDNIKRIVELENSIRFALSILPLWGCPSESAVKPEYNTEAQALCQMENSFRFLLGQKKEQQPDIELPF